MAKRVLSPTFVMALSLALFWAIWLVPRTFSAERLNYGTSFKAPHFDLPAIAAEERGLWAKNGLEVRWYPFVGGIWQAMSAGSIDLAVSGASSAIISISRGVPALIVADMKIKYPYFLWVRGDSPRKKPSDLKGAKIGVTRFGEAAHMMTLAMIDALGLKNQVTFSAVGGASAGIAAVKTEAVDAYVAVLFPVASLKVKGDIREIASTQGVLPKKWSNQLMTAHKALAERKPRIIKAGVKTVLESVKFIMTNPTWAMEKLRSRWGYNEEAAKLVFKALRYGTDGKIDPEVLQNVNTFLVENGILAKEKAVPIEKLYTTRFID